MGVVALFEVIAPPGLCVAPLYVLPLLVASQTLDPRPIVAVAVAASALIVAAALLAPATWIALAERLIALALLWAVAVFRIAQLRRERHRREWAAVVATSREAIIAMDLDGRVREWNARAANLYGFEPAPASTPGTLESMLGTSDDTMRAALRRVLDGKVEETFHDHHRQADGTPMTVAVTLSPVMESAGELVGMSAVVRDVTLEMRAQQALADSEARHRARTSELDDAARQRSEFISMLGHELRNPLGAIGNAASVLRLADPRSARGARALEIIESQVALMRRQLDDMLTLSRSEHGSLELKFAPVAVAEVVSLAVDAMHSHLEASGISVDVAAIEPDLVVWADRFRLGQVMHNLLDNAAKFTAGEGRVSIGCTAHDETIDITVADQGVGIAPALLPHVFDEFSQAEQHVSRQSGGMGLGLAIVKRLVELHGGSVTPESSGVPGEGTRFVVSLPRHRGEVAARPAADAPQASASRARHVLVADDNVEALRALSDYLELNGFQVSEAIDGEHVLQMLEDCAEAASPWPDALVLDIGLPGRDGLEIAREVRARWPTRECALIAVTGYGSSSMAERAANAGFDHHFVKPVRLDQLCACLA